MASKVVRQTYRGGWPLGFTSATCPAEAPVGCQSIRVYNLNCCPSGQFCFGTMQPYCCPTENDCGAAVKNVPVCADSTWIMYQNPRVGDDDFFCCPAGYIGVIPTSGSSGVCEAEGIDLPKSQLAPVASQVGTSPATASGAAPTTTAPRGGPSVTAGGGATETTTGGNGAQTGITGGGSGDNAASSSSSSLSTGAIAGIAVGGVAAIAIAIAAFAFVLWLHRRSLRNRPAPAPVPTVHPTPSEVFSKEHSRAGHETQVEQAVLSQASTPSPAHEYQRPAYGASEVQADSLSRHEMEAPAHGVRYDGDRRQGY